MIGTSKMTPALLKPLIFPLHTGALCLEIEDVLPFLETAAGGWAGAPSAPLCGASASAATGALSSAVANACMDIAGTSKLGGHFFIVAQSN